MANNPIEKTSTPFMGILMLDTQFPRLVGDIGNPASFDFPTRKSIIKGAFPEAIIKQEPEKCLEDFISAAIDFEQNGAKLITTSCGFLTLFQKDIADAVNIPVLTSSLFLYNDLVALQPQNKTVGILTIAASSLTRKHLEAANISANMPIGTTEKGTEFSNAILENRSNLNFEIAQRDNVEAALTLQSANPNLGAILLECTNMPPYADAITEATGLPVYSILDGLNDIWQKA